MSERDCFELVCLCRCYWPLAVFQVVSMARHGGGCDCNCLFGSVVAVTF